MVICTIYGDMYNTVSRAVKLRDIVVNLYNITRCQIAEDCSRSHCRVQHESRK
jgi:hypothetical protein